MTLQATTAFAILMGSSRGYGEPPTLVNGARIETAPTARRVELVRQVLDAFATAQPVGRSCSAVPRLC